MIDVCKSQIYRMSAYITFDAIDRSLNLTPTHALGIWEIFIFEIEI